MNYSRCSRCSGTIYGYTYVNMHPHLKIHEDCACLMTPPGSPTRVRPGSRGYAYGSPPRKTSYDVEPWVLGPETLVEMLEARLRDPYEEGTKIQGDIDSLKKVMQAKPASAKRRKMAPNEDVIGGIEVQNGTLGAVTVVLIGSRALRYWCDACEVACREVDASDYDFIVVDMDPRSRTPQTIDIIKGKEGDGGVVAFRVCGSSFHFEMTDRDLPMRAPFKVRITTRVQ